MKIEFSAPLHRILCDKYGFLMFSSSPSEKEKEEYLKVCELLNREDLPFMNENYLTLLVCLLKEQSILLIQDYL